MLITVSFYTKNFVAQSQKEAYFKACKWVAKNIVNSKNELVDTTWKIEKSDICEVTLTIFSTLEESEHKAKFCQICKDYHRSFFINEDYNCSRCNLNTYRKRLVESTNIKKTYRKEILNRKE